MKTKESPTIIERVGFASMVGVVAGSGFACQVPNDGMAALVVFPFWILGGLLGIGTVVAYLAARPGKATGKKLAYYAAVSLGSIAVAIVVGVVASHSDEIHSLLPHLGN